TYTDLTHVNQGTLLLDLPAGNILSNNLIIGDGIGLPGTATARWMFPNQLHNLGGALVNSDCIADLNNKTDDFSGLTIIDGAGTTVNAGYLQVDGTVGNVSLNGGTLGGIGTVGVVTSTATGGTINPGAASPGPGILHSSDVTLNSASTFFVDLFGGTVGSQYDRLIVNGTIDLGGSLLSGSPAPSLNVGDSFTIITATNVVGQFAQGGVAFVGGKKFSITYTGNSVIL